MAETHGTRRCKGRRGNRDSIARKENSIGLQISHAQTARRSMTAVSTTLQYRFKFLNVPSRIAHVYIHV